jgi:hypothetical protein
MMIMIYIHILLVLSYNKMFIEPSKRVLTNISQSAFYARFILVLLHIFALKGVMSSVADLGRGDGGDRPSQTDLFFTFDHRAPIALEKNLFFLILWNFVFASFGRKRCYPWVHVKKRQNFLQGWRSPLPGRFSRSATVCPCSRLNPRFILT